METLPKKLLIRGLEKQSFPSVQPAIGKTMTSMIPTSEITGNITKRKAKEIEE